MTIDEAIKHCQEVSYSCNNKECSLEHTQLTNWLIELKYYRDRYGSIEKNHPTIILTKSNLDKEKIRVDEITRIEKVDGVFNDNRYQSRIWFNNGDYHYYIESSEEINNLINQSNSCKYGKCF